MNPDNKTIQIYLNKCWHELQDYDEFNLPRILLCRHCNRIMATHVWSMSDAFISASKYPDYTAEGPAFFEFFRAIQKDERWKDFLRYLFEKYDYEYVDTCDCGVYCTVTIFMNPETMNPPTLTRLWCEFIKEDA